MAVKISKVEVWGGDVQDRAGGLAAILESLANSGATIECCIARRLTDQLGGGTVYVSPVRGKKAQAAARAAGLQPVSDVVTLRLEGTDKRGGGAKLTRAVANLGISMRGLTAAVIGNKYVAYFGFDRAEDADRAIKAIKKASR